MSRRTHIDLPPVRILPMSDKIEGFANRSIEQIQANFFLKRFVRSKGQFYYCSSGLNAPAGTPVMFQFKARIIASAVLLRNDRFEQVERGFAGVLQFDPKTIRTFEPLDADAMRQAWPGFRAFGHAKQKLNPGGWPAFERLMKKLKQPSLASSQ